MRIIDNGQKTALDGRKGFTLVELLMVLSILLILVALLAGVVLKVLGLGPQAVTQSEMNGFASAIGAFKQEFGVSYIPSRLLLCEDGNYAAYNGTSFQQLATDSQTYLAQIFGSRFPVANTVPGFQNIDWNSDGSIYPTVNKGLNPPMILEGQHCLVFFLGGMQSPVSSGSNTCLGFSTNPTSPTAAGGTRRGGGSLFDFKSIRLFRDTRPIPNSSPGTNLNFFVYIDAFNQTSPPPGVAGWTNTYPKQPYAYFSSYRTSNNYNRYGSSDCPSLQYQQGSSTTAPPQLQPYFVPNTSNFLNPSSYQIISAGPDGVFGVPPISTTSVVGGAWAGAVGNGTPGLDDWGNFSRVTLGAPQQ